MIDPIRAASLAEAHRRELVREARQARLAAAVIQPTESVGDRALLLLADSLAGAGERLRTRLQLKRLARLHAATANTRRACPVGHCLGAPAAR
jgi:hypothetical protein